MKLEEREKGGVWVWNEMWEQGNTNTVLIFSDLLESTKRDFGETNAGIRIYMQLRQSKHSSHALSAAMAPHSFLFSRIIHSFKYLLLSVLVSTSVIACLASVCLIISEASLSVSGSPFFPQFLREFFRRLRHSSSCGMFSLVHTHTHTCSFSLCLFLARSLLQ